jgi:hypothetical protein
MEGGTDGKKMGYVERVTRIVRDPGGREILISSRTTTGSVSLDKVNAWERCCV